MAYSISNGGYIVAEGIDAYGQTHSYLLQATPEPTSLISLVIGLGCVGVRRSGGGDDPGRVTDPDGQTQRSEFGSKFGRATVDKDGGCPTMGRFG